MQNAKEINQLKVMKGKNEIGLLTRTQDGYELSFYSTWYQKMISYHIKGDARSIQQSGVNLPPYFANLLPEGLRLKSLLKKIKTSEDDLFSLLAAAGGTCVGDVYVVGVLETKLPLLVSPKKISFYEFFLAHAGGPHLDSFSGVQEKISSSMISFPVNVAKKNKQYILKLNPKDKPNLVENEFACMQLAKKCKLNVATVRVVTDRDDQKGLLVERFDRVWDEARNEFEMIHQEDACQFLNIYPAQKYRVTWKEIAEKVIELTNSEKIEILNLIKLYAFSYLIGNGDLHAKNISLYDPPGRPRILTPAYDLICTRIYGDQNMALKFDGKDDNIKRSMLIDFGKRFGVSADLIHSMLDKLLELFQKNSPLLLSFPMSSKEKNTLIQMIQKRVGDLSRIEGKK